jgi:hypothetical protein
MPLAAIGIHDAVLVCSTHEKLRNCDESGFRDSPGVLTRTAVAVAGADRWRLRNFGGPSRVMWPPDGRLMTPPCGPMSALKYHGVMCCSQVPQQVPHITPPGLSALS